MTAVHASATAASWSEPPGIAPRGTVVVVPGRGENATVYERFGRRIAADGYRVVAVADPTDDEARAEGEIRALLGEADRPQPRVLVGSDTGALFAAGLAAAGVPGLAGLILAGLPAPGPGHALSWEDELAARTACPAHRNRLSTDPAHRRGAFVTPVPDGWFTRARPAAVAVPVLGVHGAADPVSPLDGVRDFYAALPAGELVAVTGGRHDALNDQTHRTAAATVVLFLERLRLGVDLPVLARVLA